MDWTRCELIDTIWARLASWEGVWLFWEGRFASPLCMVFTVRALTSSVRKCTHSNSLWTSICRPYLIHVEDRYRERVVLCEYAIRKFVYSVTSTFAYNDEVNVTFAGGFAAWQLERQIQTLHHLDGFPRCLRDTTFSDGLPRNDLWIPDDINVFFTGDETRVLPVILQSYGSFCKLLFDLLFLPFIRQEERVDMDADEEEHDAEKLFHRTMIDAQFPCVIAEGALRDFNKCRDGMGNNSLSVVRKWRLSSRTEFLFPTDINIVQTRRMDNSLDLSSPYSERLLASFDLSHCCVAVRVGNAGEWLFEYNDEAADCIKHRRLRFNSSGFLQCKASTIDTVKRLVKYHMNGFTFRGVPFTI